MGRTYEDSLQQKYHLCGFVENIYSKYLSRLSAWFNNEIIVKLLCISRLWRFAPKKRHPLAKLASNISTIFSPITSIILDTPYKNSATLIYFSVGPRSSSLLNTSQWSSYGNISLILELFTQMVPKRRLVGLLTSTLSPTFLPWFRFVQNFLLTTVRLLRYSRHFIIATNPPPLPQITLIVRTS